MVRTVVCTSQRAEVARTLKPMYEAKARERQAAVGGDRKSVMANLPQAIDGKGAARDQAAAAVGVSGRTVQDAEYGTFEDYCRERWGMTRMHAGRMIAAAQVFENVTDRLQIEPPSNIEQTRPLAKLPPKQQADAWTAAAWSSLVK